MHPSLTTAFLSLMPACLLTAGLLAWNWRTTDRAWFIGSWALASCMAALALLLFGLRGVLPEVLVILGANVALHLAHMLLWAGARWLRGAHVPLWVLPLPSLVWLAACAMPGFLETALIRLALASAMFAVEALALAFEMKRGGGKGRSGSLALMMAGMALLHAIILTIQLVGLMLSFRVTSVTFVAIVMDGPVFVAIGFLGFALANARSAERDAALLAQGRLRESELQTRAAEREAAAQRAGRAEVERLHKGLPAIIFLREVKADGVPSLLYRSGDMEAVTGWPAESLEGVDNLATFAENPALLREAFLLAKQHGVGAVDWRMRRPDGGWTWLRTYWTVQERLLDGGAVLVGYCINISAEREANARLAASARLAALGEMATGLAHELKQPLQAILLDAELVQVAAGRKASAEIMERLEAVISQTLRAGSIIDNLRRFAQGDSVATPVEPISLATAIANVLTLIYGSLRDSAVRVEIRLPEDVPAVLGHPVALEQVLTNLLFNARDALVSGPAGADRSVTVTAEASAGQVRLSVADTGGGIPPEVAEHLFEPFVTTKGPDRGTGLGLSISHGLIEAMGGSIEARNGAEGAVFTITLSAAAPKQIG